MFEQEDGAFLEVLWGWIIEKCWIKFENEGKIWIRILRGVVGSIFVAAFYVGFSPVFKPIFMKFDSSLLSYYMIKMFIIYFIVIAVYPACFVAVQKAIAQKKK
ncbi:MAG: hypothetical protein SPI86_10235 [Treponemataceae bacterium]|nr:hypothetical protein [Spirochaetales bacterium]MDY6032120.1 hypothetical protein [Treponemataceae bacterium]